MKYEEMEQRFCPPMAWAEIDLKALAHNARAIKKFAGNKVQILAVVKAQGYGHGLKEVVKVLENQGIEFFGVSDINEAILIRKAKVKKPILLLLLG